MDWAGGLIGLGALVVREATLFAAVGFILLMTLANLRGLKESGRLFAGPTYVYILALAALVGSLELDREHLLVDEGANAGALRGLLRHPTP